MDYKLADKERVVKPLYLEEESILQTRGDAEVI